MKLTHTVIIIMTLLAITGCGLVNGISEKLNRITPQQYGAREAIYKQQEWVRLMPDITINADARGDNKISVFVSGVWDSASIRTGLVYMIESEEEKDIQSLGMSDSPRNKWSYSEMQFNCQSFSYRIVSGVAKIETYSSPTTYSDIGSSGWSTGKTSEIPLNHLSYADPNWKEKILWSATRRVCDGSYVRENAAAIEAIRAQEEKRAEEAKKANEAKKAQQAKDAEQAAKYAVSHPYKLQLYSDFDMPIAFAAFGYSPYESFGFLEILNSSDHVIYSGFGLLGNEFSGPVFSGGLTTHFRARVRSSSSNALHLKALNQKGEVLIERMVPPYGYAEIGH